MKRGKIILLGAGLLGAAAAAEPPIEFSGVLVADGRPKIALTDKTTHTTRWVDPGAVFNGYTVVRYLANEEAVFVRKDGQEYRLLLVPPKTSDTPQAPIGVALRVAVTAPPATATPPAAAPPAAAGVLAPESPAAGAPTGGAPAGTPSTGAATPAPVAATGSAAITRAVEQGETLEAIAGKSGLTVLQLKALNPTVNESSLQPGQVIRIR